MCKSGYLERDKEQVASSYVKNTLLPSRRYWLIILTSASLGPQWNKNALHIKKIHLKKYVPGLLSYPTCIVTSSPPTLHELDSRPFTPPCHIPYVHPSPPPKLFPSPNPSAGPLTNIP